MPKFHSLRSVSSLGINDESREPLSAFRTTATENAEALFNQELQLTHATRTTVLSHEHNFHAKPVDPIYYSKSPQSDSATQRGETTSAKYRAPQVNAEQALQPLQSYQSQSLVTALQLTMEPKTNRLPVLIPGEMKRTKLQPVTEELSTVTRRTISRFKMGIVLGAMMTFTFLTALSFAPANQGMHILAF